MLIDRTGWPSGPWDHETDRTEWIDVTGLPCLAQRNRLGAWCGYVAVPPGHPLHGKDYGDVDVKVHGGLTYAAACTDHICHVPAPGEPDDVWWFGFDCAHLGDLIPSMIREKLGLREESYRDFNYIQEQCTLLAQQLK